MEIGLILKGVIAILLVYLINKYCIQIYVYWRRRGIPSVDGALPFIGNAFQTFWKHKSFACFCDDVYKSKKERSMVGFFEFGKPNLMILDPELIKTVLMSDFSKFHENVFKVDEKADPLLTHNPFFNSGEKWKIQRNRLSYALMSSKRLRILCNAVTGVCQKFTKYIRENIDKSRIQVFEVDAKELANRFTGEVVASGAFGIEGHFFVNETSPNSFRSVVFDFMEPTLFNTIQQIALFFIPYVSSIFSISFLPKKVDHFFRHVIHEQIVLRNKDGIARNDFLQLMLENRRNGIEEMNEEIITANATSFFLDGYETSAITLGFFVYQIAKNPAVQEKLRHEVNTVLDKYDGEINYESLAEMTYMDQALNESMRLYPALGFIKKKCVESCKLVGHDGLECIVESGTEMAIPVQALHRDPNYWENPDLYDPERFSAECKNDRPKTVFLPFGEGPRICVGMRFATMQIKGAVATILKHFRIQVSPKTKEPLEVARSPVLTVVEGGIWINFKPI